jgi:signal transduction histidine kinase
LQHAIEHNSKKQIVIEQYYSFALFHWREHPGHGSIKDQTEEPQVSALSNVRPAFRRKRIKTVRTQPRVRADVSAELQRERSELAVQKMCALGEMTKGIAHDFRNILCIVASGLRVAGKSSHKPDQLEAALAAISDGVARGEKMTARLLRFASQQDLVASPEDVNTLLSKLEAFLKYGAGSGIRMELSLGTNLPNCLVDPPRFNAAMLNLVVNARDAMPDGGVIRISTAAVRGTDHGRPCEYVRVRVRDHGSGMSPDVLQRIFDPYFTTKGDSGTGLGVPQVQALLQEVDGFVRVHSTVGKGTSFDLFFPAHDEHQPVAGDAWRQLDEWANEGGAIVGSTMHPAISAQ